MRFWDRGRGRSLELVKLRASVTFKLAMSNSCGLLADGQACMQLINRGTAMIWCLIGCRSLVVLTKDRDLRPLV
jgi:hypothetical protein